MTRETAFPDPLETCACPLCGADRAQPTPYQHPPYRVQKCQNCGLWYLSPRLTAAATAALYENDAYFSGGAAGYKDYRAQERSLRKTFRLLLGQMHELALTGGSLLEIGAGLGYLLDEARPYFGPRMGIELSPLAAKEAAERSDATILPSLDRLDPAMAFDCIVAAHVIEHIHEPVPFVGRLLHHLHPDGVLVLAAPDMGSLFRKIMGRRWPSFKYPEHVSFFDAHTLPRLLRAAGFVDPIRLPYPHAFPLSLVLTKLGLPSPRFTHTLDITLPATTICFAGRQSKGETE